MPVPKFEQRPPLIFIQIQLLQGIIEGVDPFVEIINDGISSHSIVKNDSPFYLDAVT